QAASGATTVTPGATAAAVHPAQDTHPKALPRGAGTLPGSAAASVSPAVRRLLAEHALDATAVPGTGQGGRIPVADARRAAAAGANGTQSDRAATAAVAESGNAAAEPGVRRVPHTAVRRRIAEHMVQSLLHTAPHVTTVFEANLGAVLQHRAAHREEFAR